MCLGESPLDTLNAISHGTAGDLKHPLLERDMFGSGTDTGTDLQKDLIEHGLAFKKTRRNAIHDGVVVELALDVLLDLIQVVIDGILKLTGRFN